VFRRETGLDLKRIVGDFPVPAIGTNDSLVEPPMQVRDFRPSTVSTW
jgi:hypothetical protein